MPNPSVSCSPVIAPSVRQAFAPCATAGSRDGLCLSLSKLILRIVLLLWVLFSDSQASQMQAQEGGDASRPASENAVASSKDPGSSPPLSSTGKYLREPPSSEGERQPPGTVVPGPPPEVIQEEDGSLKIGLIHVDPVKKQVKIPAQVNMLTGPLEYFLVTEFGKRHEAMFLTHASPVHIQAGCLLLGWQPHVTKGLPSSQIRIEVEWAAEDGMRRKGLEEVITIGTHERPNVDEPNQPTGPDLMFVFAGSRMHRGRWIVKDEGSIISLMGDPYAIIDNAGYSRHYDDIYDPTEGVFSNETMPVSIVLSMEAMKEVP